MLYVVIAVLYMISWSIGPTKAPVYSYIYTMTRLCILVGLSQHNPIRPPLISSTHWGMNKIWPTTSEIYFNDRKIYILITISLTFVTICPVGDKWAGNSYLPTRTKINDAYSKMQFSILFYWSMSSDLLILMPSDEYHRATLMMSQHRCSGEGLVASGNYP